MSRSSLLEEHLIRKSCSGGHCFLSSFCGAERLSQAALRPLTYMLYNIRDIYMCEKASLQQVTMVTTVLTGDEARQNGVCEQVRGSSACLPVIDHLTESPLKISNCPVEKKTRHIKPIGCRFLERSGAVMVEAREEGLQPRKAVKMNGKSSFIGLVWHLKQSV